MLLVDIFQIVINMEAINMEYGWLCKMMITEVLNSGMTFKDCYENVT